MVENEFIKSDITFRGSDAFFLKYVARMFEDLKEVEKLNYSVFVMCAYLGLKLTPEERRESLESEECIIDEPITEKESFNIPRSVLHTKVHDLKRLLFSVGVNHHHNDLDVIDLQKLWNRPSLSKRAQDENGIYAVEMYKHTVNGAKYIYYLLEIKEADIKYLNEKLLEIYSSEPAKITLAEENIEEDEIIEAPINTDKLESDINFDEFLG